MSASDWGQIDDGGGDELVAVAFTRDLTEAEMIRGLLEASGVASIQELVGVDGPLLGFGLSHPGDGQRRVMVRAEQEQEAKVLLSEAVAEGEEEAWPEIANAEHLADAGGGTARNYGLVGASFRIFLSSVGFFAVVFGVFMLLRVT